MKPPLPTAVYRVLNPKNHGGKKYELFVEITYHSHRYDKWVTVPPGYRSDGATGAKDLPESISWWVHDILCETGIFDDASACTNWQASMILRDILCEEGYKVRKRTWTWATFLFGGWGLKKRNGWITL